MCVHECVPNSSCTCSLSAFPLLAFFAISHASLSAIDAVYTLSKVLESGALGCPLTQYIGLKRTLSRVSEWNGWCQIYVRCCV